MLRTFWAPVSLLFVQSIIPDSVDKTKIFTFSVFLKKTNKFTEREERAGTDCYHTHHITTIAADNCGFLLKIEHTTPDTTTEPVPWCGSSAGKLCVIDWEMLRHMDGLDWSPEPGRPYRRGRTMALYGSLWLSLLSQTVSQIVHSLGSYHSLFIVRHADRQTFSRGENLVECPLPPSLTRQSSLFSENGALCVGTAAVVAGSESPLSCWGLAGAGVEYLKSCRGEGGNVCLTNDVLSDAI